MTVGRVLADWEKIDAALSEAGYPNAVSAPTRRGRGRVHDHTVPLEQVWRAASIGLTPTQKHWCFECWKVAYLTQAITADDGQPNCLNATSRFELDCGVDR